MTIPQKFVAAAYVVALAYVLLYPVLQSLKVARLAREIDALDARLSRTPRSSVPAHAPRSLPGACHPENHLGHPAVDPENPTDASAPQRTPVN